MDVKQELREFFGDRPILYIKFTRNRQWAEDILNGKIFMNKIDYYRMLELNSGVKGQGDIEELKSTVIPLELELIHNESNTSIPIDASKLQFEFREDKDKAVFCMTGLTIDDMIIDSYDSNLVKLKFPYKMENIDLLKHEFGEYAAIFSPEEFKAKLSKALEKEGIEWILEKVKYVHENSLEKLHSFLEGRDERFLYKNLEFEHQKEYRLILDENIEKAKVLFIESLNKHIGVKKLDELLNADLTLTFSDKKR